MKRILSVAALIFALLLTACEGEITSYPKRGALGEAVCPPGTHLTTTGTSHAAACASDR